MKLVRFTLILALSLQVNLSGDATANAETNTSNVNNSISSVLAGLNITATDTHCRYTRDQLIQEDRKALEALNKHLDMTAANAHCADLSKQASDLSRNSANLTGAAAQTAYEDSQKLYAQASECYQTNIAMIPKDKDALADDWACLELQDHLRDDVMSSCTPNPSLATQFVPKAPLRVEGKESYHFASLPFLGFAGAHISKAYRYTMSPEADGSLGITVKIQFTGPVAQQAAMQAAIQPRLNAAAEIWGKQSPNGSIHFHFLSVGPNEKPDFTVNLKPDAKGDLYDTYWLPTVFTDSTGESTIAHELGHMMGIPDEYDPVRSVTWEIKDDLDTLRCNPRGIMCNFYNKKIYPYYYYLITRRGPCVDQSASDLSSSVKGSLEQIQKLKIEAKPENCAPADAASIPNNQ